MCWAQLQSCRGGWWLVVAPLADPEHAPLDLMEACRTCGKLWSSVHIHTKVCAELAGVVCSGDFCAEYFLSTVFPCVPKVAFLFLRGFVSYLLCRPTITPASQLSSTCARRTAFTRPVPARTATKKWSTNRTECSAARSATKSFPTSSTALSSLWVTHFSVSYSATSTLALRVLYIFLELKRKWFHIFKHFCSNENSCCRYVAKYATLRSFYFGIERLTQTRLQEGI